ncbi:MAG: UDP-N-acetylmuramate dehydrogenase [Chitinophagaceae bacterium]|nr:UDP-N-acetylmuramate dehydrogenase [Chitinophagaceae bacterium]MCW5928749.1 UDP-N-acetylmuramate dehydrogenase [Chitinophagaceae bacterium]
MQIQENFSLRQYNSFGINAGARFFASFKTLEELEELVDHARHHKKLVLGGGTNILLTGDFDGWVLKNDLTGIEEAGETGEEIFVKAGAGENWNSFVQYAISRDWAGLENLSLIPGNVGAAPMQNIGAYGVELESVFNGLEAYHLKDKAVHSFTVGDCQLGYRDSIFKNKLKDQYVILNVSFRLRKQPVFHTEYGAIRQELERMQVQELSIGAIARAVINIRSSKLPDPAKIGNAGSFFKNPSVPADRFRQLEKEHKGIVGYKNPDGSVKLAAGWLIEQCGWKGFRRGDAGVHAHQALVLVNYGAATGKEIYRLSEEIQQSVRDRFAVTLEREVNII